MTFVLSSICRANLPPGKAEKTVSKLSRKREEDWPKVSCFIAICIKQRAKPDKANPMWEEIAATACAVQVRLAALPRESHLLLLRHFVVHWTTILWLPCCKLWCIYVYNAPKICYEEGREIMLLYVRCSVLCAYAMRQAKNNAIICQMFSPLC